MTVEPNNDNPDTEYEIELISVGLVKKAVGSYPIESKEDVIK